MDGGGGPDDKAWLCCGSMTIEHEGRGDRDEACQGKSVAMDIEAVPDGGAFRFPGYGCNP